jgi:hypothetical protein
VNNRASCCVCSLLPRWYHPGLILRPWRWRQYVFTETSVYFQRTTRRYIAEDSATDEFSLGCSTFWFVFTRSLVRIRTIPRESLPQVLLKNVGLYLNKGHKVSFHVLSNSSFINPNIRRYVVWATGSVYKWTVNKINDNEQKFCDVISINFVHVERRVSVTFVIWRCCCASPEIERLWIYFLCCKAAPNKGSFCFEDIDLRSIEGLWP